MYIRTSYDQFVIDTNEYKTQYAYEFPLDLSWYTYPKIIYVEEYPPNTNSTIIGISPNGNSIILNTINAEQISLYIRRYDDDFIYYRKEEYDRLVQI